MTIETREQDGNGYFGLCPHCRKVDGYLNVGRGHWFYCDEHKTRWHVGSNLFSTWQFETEDEQREKYEKKDFGTYQDIEPVYPRNVVFKTQEVEMGWRTDASAAAFQQRAGLEPATGDYAKKLEAMSRKCFETIKIIELERSGIRDGDGYWHGSDVMGGAMHGIADLAKQTLEAATEAHAAKPYAEPHEDDHIKF